MELIYFLASKRKSVCTRGMELIYFLASKRKSVCIFTQNSNVEISVRLSCLHLISNPKLEPQLLQGHNMGVPQ